MLLNPKRLNDKINGYLDQAVKRASSPQFARVYFDGSTSYIDTATTGDFSFTDPVNGTVLLSTLGGASHARSHALLTVADHSDVATYLNQAVLTSSSPTFAGLTLGALSGVLKATAGVISAVTIGTSLSYSAPVLDAIQDIRTAASPTFGGLTVGALAGMIKATAGVLSAATAGTDYPGLAFGNTFTAAQKINVNSTTALFVEQDGVKDNTFIVNTTNGRVGVRVAPLTELHVSGATVLGTDNVPMPLLVATTANGGFGVQSPGNTNWVLNILYQGTPATATRRFAFGVAAAASNFAIGTVQKDAVLRSYFGKLHFATCSTGDGTTNDPVRLTLIQTGQIGIGNASPTAMLHLPAGLATANYAPLKFTSGVSLTTAVAGSVEFTTDDLFFTITTGAARKRLLMADVVGGLTSGRIPAATTNGRLADGPTPAADGTYVSPTSITISKGLITAIAAEIKAMSFVIFTPVSTDDILLIKLPRGITVTQVSGICIGGTNVVGQLQEYAIDGTTPVDTQAADTTYTTSQVTNTTFNNAAMDASDWLGWKMTSISGTVTSFHLTIWYYEV